MSYKHFYPMLLEVPGMIETGSVGLTPVKVAEALRAMADRLEATPSILQDIVGREPVHAQQEDLWVLRDISQPCVIRKADGGWVLLRAEDIPLSDMVDSDGAARMQRKNPAAFEGAVWSRPEDIDGTPILAEIRGGEKFPTMTLDLREFLSTGPRELVQYAAETGWTGEGMWAAFDDLLEFRVPAAVALKDAMDLEGLDAKDVEFSVQDPARAMRFAQDCRPGILDDLDFKDEGMAP